MTEIVLPQNQQPASWIALHKRSVLTGGAILIALATIGLGSFSLISYLKIIPTGIGSFAAIPLPVDILLYGVGGTILCILIGLRLRNCKIKSDSKTETGDQSTEEVPPVNKRDDQSSNTTEHLEKQEEQSSALSGLQINLEPEEEEFFEKLCYLDNHPVSSLYIAYISDELKTASNKRLFFNQLKYCLNQVSFTCLRHRIESIYAGKGIGLLHSYLFIGEIYPNSKDSNGVSKLRKATEKEFANRIKFSLLENKGILDLKLKEIEEHDKWEILILLLRLSIIGNQENINTFPKKNLKEIQEPLELTLNDLRQLDPETIVSCPLLSSSPLLVLLSNWQIDKMLEQNLMTEDRFKNIFASNPSWLHVLVEKNTEYLSSLSIENLQKCISFFSEDHLPMLSVTQVSNEAFPWMKIHKDLVKYVFQSEGQSKIAAIKMDVLKDIAQYLTPSLFSYCSLEQLNDPKFPWDKLPTGSIDQIFSFISSDDPSNYTNVSNKKKLEGLNDNAFKQVILALSGRQLHFLSENQVKQADFPWDKIESLKFKKMFSVNQKHKLQTARLLQSLPLESIKKIIYHLSGDQILHLSDGQLEDPNFPWDKITKEQFGSISYSYRQIFRDKLSILNENVINKIAPKLTEEQLRFLSVDQLNNQEFPWETLTKENLSKMFLSEINHSLEKKLPALSVEARRKIFKNAGPDLLRERPSHFVDIFSK